MADSSVNGGVGLGQIIAAVLIALIAGGTAPWWWDKLFEKAQSPSTEIVRSEDNLPKASGGLRKDDIGIVPISWNDSPYGLSISKSVGEVFRFSCEPNDVGSKLYGTTVYTGSSSICEAAVHSGSIIREQGGEVWIEVKGKQQSFKGSQRNGVLSREYSAYGTSFIVLPN